MQNHVLGVFFDSLGAKVLLSGQDGIRSEKQGSESFKEAIERETQTQLNLTLDWHYAGMVKGNKPDGYYNEAIFFAYDDNLFNIKTEDSKIVIATRSIEEEVADRKLWYLIPFGVLFKNDKRSFMNLEFFSI